MFSLFEKIIEMIAGNCIGCSDTSVPLEKKNTKSDPGTGCRSMDRKNRFLEVAVDWSPKELLRR